MHDNCRRTIGAPHIKGIAASWIVELLRVARGCGWAVGHFDDEQLQGGNVHRNERLARREAIGVCAEFRVGGTWRAGDDEPAGGRVASLYDSHRAIAFDFQRCAQDILGQGERAPRRPVHRLAVGGVDGANVDQARQVSQLSGWLS